MTIVTKWWDVIYWIPESPEIASHERFPSDTRAHFFADGKKEEGFQVHGPLCSTNIIKGKP